MPDAQPAVQPRFQWCCEKGCGPCEVKRTEVEYERLETLRGSLISSKTIPQLVSACCGAGLSMWDNERGEEIDVNVERLPLGPQNVAPAAAATAPDCGACPGDGSICAKDCRLAAESPPVTPSTAPPFRVSVQPMQASNGLTWVVCLDRGDRPLDAKPWDDGRLTPVNRNDLDEANHAASEWAEFLGVPFTPAQPVEDTRSQAENTVPEYGLPPRNGCIAPGVQVPTEMLLKAYVALDALQVHTREDPLLAGPNWCADLSKQGLRATLSNAGVDVGDFTGATPPAGTRQAAAATEDGARSQADAQLRALLRYTESFYGVAIQHGVKAAFTANCIAHIERTGKALHRLVHAWTSVAAHRAATPLAAPTEAPRSAYTFADAKHRATWATETLKGLLETSQDLFFACVEAGMDRQCIAGLFAHIEKPARALAEANGAAPT